MSYKGKFFIIGLLLLVFLSVSIVSATDNETVLKNISSFDEGIINEYENSLDIDKCAKLNKNIQINNDLNLSNFEINYGDENNGDLLTVVDDSNLSLYYTPYKSDLQIVSIESNYNEPIKIKVKLTFDEYEKLKIPMRATLGYIYANINGTTTNKIRVTESCEVTLISSDNYYSDNVPCYVKFEGGEFTYNYTTYRIDSAHKKIYAHISPLAVIFIENDGKNYTFGKKYSVNVCELYNNAPLPNKKIKLVWYDSSNNYLSEEYGTTSFDGTYKFVANKNVGNYVLEVILIDENYISDSNIFDVNIIRNNAKINVGELPSSYPDPSYEIKVTDSKNNPLKNIKIKIDVYKSSKKILSEYDTTDSEGFIYDFLDFGPGNYKIVFTPFDKNYDISSISKNFKIKKGYVKITTKKVIGDTRSYITLKAIVKDKDGNYLEEGVVKFKINGKTYKVKAKYGIISKKIKLTKAKTYKYEVTFLSPNYNSKSSYSNVIIKKAPEYYTIKVGKYSCKVSYNDYKKIKKATKKGHFIKKYNTEKTINYKVYAKKKITKTIKKLYSHTWKSGNEYITVNYDNAWYCPDGYTFYGKVSKIKSDDFKHYAVYKKTYYKKVLVKTPKTKVYISIEATPWHGAIAKIYHLKTVYDGSYYYYLGNQKSIF